MGPAHSQQRFLATEKQPIHTVSRLQQWGEKSFHMDPLSEPVGHDAW